MVHSSLFILLTQLLHRSFIAPLHFLLSPIEKIALNAITLLDIGVSRWCDPDFAECDSFFAAVDGGNCSIVDDQRHADVCFDHGKSVLAAPAEDRFVLIH